MNFFRSVRKALCSRGGAYALIVLGVLAFSFIKDAVWTHVWIKDMYPLGNLFIPTILSIVAVVTAVLFAYLVTISLRGDKEPNKAMKVFDVFYIIFGILSVVFFIYGCILLFGLDSKLTMWKLAQGINALYPSVLLIIVGAVLPLVFVVCTAPKKALQALIASTLAIVLAIVPLFVHNVKKNDTNNNIQPYTFESENVLKGAVLEYETLSEHEKADAANILTDSDKYWTAQYPTNEIDGMLKNGSYAEIKLSKATTFNTALIQEIGNQAEYFRLQAFVDEQWVTIYSSEKIQANRICSFDAVTTDKVRLCIDKFRSETEPVKIKSLRLYNEPARDAKNFEVTTYQRLDGDVPSEILTKGEEYINNYARFYDVYSTVIVFCAVYWDENGKLAFSNGSEEEFAKEIAALREIINHRSNKDHEVKIIITALADGAWQDMGGVNGFMALHWKSVADQIVDFVNKYKFDGVDIDWEFPANADDWTTFDKFIARLDNDMQKTNPDAVISGALAAWALGMTTETLQRFDQIQFMAYDGCDEEGYQSSLEQAQAGLKVFADNGADISKINIGIAAYGRPTDLTPYWATWRDLKQANYWDNKYYSIHDGGQVYDGTFCSPALAGDKTAYALLSGAGGVMVFRAACDKTMDDPNSVACGIENALHRYVTNW